MSIPGRGDGTIDSEERAIVEQIGSWTQRFGEAIYGSRPWKLSGEGPTKITSGKFGEGKMKPFEAADIRFTTKGSVLYAMTLGRVNGMVNIASMANTGAVKRVEVVGSDTPLPFTQDGAGLHVAVPSAASHDFGVALKIMGDGLV